MSTSEPTGSQAAAVERRRRIVEAIRRDSELTTEQIRERWGLSLRWARELLTQARADARRGGA
jgi:hypothetical protein